MTNKFYYKGHHYQVVPIEGSSDYVIIKDGRESRRVDSNTANMAMQHVDKLF